MREWEQIEGKVAMVDLIGRSGVWIAGVLYETEKALIRSGWRRCKKRVDKHEIVTDAAIYNISSLMSDNL